MAIALGQGLPAHAKEPAISFELAADPQQSTPASPSATDTAADESYSQVQPLQIPNQAEQVPLGRAKDVATLPPPPSLTTKELTQSSPVAEKPSPPQPRAKDTPAPAPQDQILQFGLAQPQPVALQSTPPQSAFDTSTSQPSTSLDAADSSLEAVVGDPAVDRLFEGGSNSLVARAVGSAEGTRTPMGDRTPAYYGHVDPGNGVWNLGSFSYQHGAKSPEDADRKQLRRLRQQARVLQAKAAERGLQLTLEEHLNGIDLANQAPMAALDRGGYIDWLYQAHYIGLQGSEAVLWARTRSFLDPDTQQWNAPGLGNTLQTISHDQERRQRAIAKAITAYQQPNLANATAESSSQGEAIAQVTQQDRLHTNQAKSFTEHLTSEMNAIAQLINFDL
jgi:hypothetical protein